MCPHRSSRICSVSSSDSRQIAQLSVKDTVANVWICSCDFSALQCLSDCDGATCSSFFSLFRCFEATIGAGNVESSPRQADSEMSDSVSELSSPLPHLEYRPRLCPYC